MLRLGSRLSLCLLLGIGLQGCGTRGADSSELRAIIDGPWTTVCLPGAGGSGSREIRLELERASLIERRERFYSDADCQKASGELSFRGRYELQVTPLEYTYTIDILFDTASALFSSEEGRAALETELACPLAAEAQNQMQDLSARAGGECAALSPLPLKNWNILAVRRGQSLTFGDGMRREAERPATVTFDDPARSFVPLRAFLLKLTDLQKYY